MMGVYYVRADGTAATKAEAIGPESDAAACMSLPTADGAAYSPADSVVVSGLGGVYRTGITFKGGDATARVTWLGSNSPVIDACSVATGWTEHVGGGELLDSLTAPANDTAFDAGADGRIVWTFTYEGGAQTTEVRCRRADWDSFVSVYCGYGVVVLKWYESGVGWHEVETAPAGTLVQDVSYTLTLEFVGSAVSVALDDTPLLSGTINYNLATAAGQVLHDLVTNDLQLDSYGPGSATENVWDLALAYQPNQIWIDGEYGTRKVNLAALASERDWYYDDATDTLHLYSPGDPDAQYTDPGVEVPSAYDTAACQSYVNVDGITLRRSRSLGMFAYNATHVKFTNCVSEWHWRIGFGAQCDAETPSTDVVFEDCISRYNGCQGFSFASLLSQDACVVRRCTANANGRYQYADTRWDDDMLYSGGIKVWNVAEDCVIEDCLVYDNGPVAGSNNGVTYGQGIWLDSAVATAGHENVVRRNLVYNNTGVALYCELTDYSRWYDNVCYDNAKNNDTGVWSVGSIRCDARNVGNATANHNKFYNNTIIGGNYGIVSLVTDPGEASEVSHNEFKNNIIVSATKSKVYADNGGDNDNVNGHGNVYDHNCFDAEANDFILWGGTAYDTYDAWEAVYGGSTNSVEVDPGLEAPASDQYWLGVGSPCLGAGVDLGPDYRLALHPRSVWPSGVRTVNQGTKPNIGAYGSEMATGAALLTYFN